MADPRKPGVLQRAAEAVAYTISGITPGTWFSPMQPLPPMAPPEVKGRVWDFPVAWNLQYIPRSGEPLPFTELKAFAETGLMRLAIQTRKDQVSALEWTIKAKDERLGINPGSSKYAAEIKTSIDFFSKPDQIHDWAQWIRAVLDQHFVLDAVALYRRRNRGGGLYSLDQMDGAMIKVLLDQDGKTPSPPSPAYQVVLKGLPAADFTSSRNQGPKYTTGELIYAVENFRVDRAYGFPRSAQIKTHVEMTFARAREQLAFYMDGNKPAGIMEGSPQLTIDQIETMQAYWEAMFAGNIEQKSKVWWVPNGSKYTAFDKTILMNEFDEWLARVICYAFSLSPTPFIKQNNRATANNATEQAESEGLRPTMNWIKSLIDPIIQFDLGYPELEFTWIEDVEYDPAAKAVIDNTYIRIGVKTIDEVRETLGMDPLGGPADKPMFATMNGYIPIDPIPPQPVGGMPGQGNVPGSISGGKIPPSSGGNGVGSKGSSGGSKNGSTASKSDLGTILINRPLIPSVELAEWAKSNNLKIPAGCKLEIVNTIATTEMVKLDDGVPIVLVESGKRSIEVTAKGATLYFTSYELSKRLDTLAEQSVGYGSDRYFSLDLSSSNIKSADNTPVPYEGPLLFGAEELDPYCGFMNKVSGADVVDAANQSDPNPTQAQIAAGNYKKGHVIIQGLDITIENAPGSIREGRHDKWSSVMPTSYGYILGTLDADGDAVDVFIGPNPESNKVWVIDQVDDDGEFDEHKTFVGYDNWSDAQKDYLDSYRSAERNEPGQAHHNIGGVLSFTMDQFKKWLSDRAATQRALEQNDHVKKLQKTVDKIVTLLEVGKGSQRPFGVNIDKAYNPDQPRDENGRWSTNGGVGTKGNGVPSELSTNEWNAIGAYTGAYSKSINKLDKGLATGTISGPEKKIADNLKNVCDRSTLQEDQLLYRGFNADYLPAGLKEGDVITFPVFLSTSTDQEVAAAFMTDKANELKHPGIMGIEASEGANAINVMGIDNKFGKSHSSFDFSGAGIVNEREFILPAGSQFEVVHMKKINGLLGMGLRYLSGKNVTKAYNPDQPRDANGRWGDGSGGSKVTVPTKEEQKQSVDNIKDYLTKISTLRGGASVNPEKFMLEQGQAFNITDKTFGGKKRTSPRVL